jgi:hypothetical protein
LRRVLVILVCVVAAAVVLLRVRARHRADPPRHFASTQEMMTWLADEAVKLGRDNGVAALDYSPDSIERAEQLLAKLHDEYRSARPASGTKGLAMAVGAYVGECIRRANPGSHWEQDHPVAGERSHPLHWRGGESFPIAWCYKRIVEGPDDNVWAKYQILRQRREDELPAGTAAEDK